MFVKQLPAITWPNAFLFVALAEVTTIMGSEAVVQAAEQYGKNFICSEKIDAVDLQDLCYKVKQ